MNAVGQEVKRIRESKGWIQAKLAVEAGMAPSAVNQIENGKRAASARSLDKLASALGVEVADLFPKAQAVLPLEGRGGALLRHPFNARTGELYATEEGRRGSIPRDVWLLALRDYVNAEVERWEHKAETGNFDRGSALEFNDSLKSLSSLLGELERWEIAKTPPEERGKNNRNLILNQPIRRLLDLLPKLRAAYEAKLEGSELEQARRGASALEARLQHDLSRRVHA